MTRFFFRCFWILFATVAIVVFMASVASACPGCKDALAENDPERNSLVKGYMYSILFMLTMPVAILGGFSAYMYRLVRRARAERVASARITSHS
jgi:heme/copper-type cytochrome/quinol oxidase subunit 2